MKRGFGSIHAASDMKNYLDRKIKREVERVKPTVRTASVVSIDRSARKCEVRYPGEEGTVRVPYGTAEPADVGERVKIDGPVGDRRIVDVIGRTRTDTRLDIAESRLEAAPATWYWDGQELPDEAEDIHPQARVGDFFVAPNLLSRPGWHRITEV